LDQRASPPAADCDLISFFPHPTQSLTVVFIRLNAILAEFAFKRASPFDSLCLAAHLIEQYLTFPLRVRYVFLHQQQQHSRYKVLGPPVAGFGPNTMIGCANELPSLVDDSYHLTRHASPGVSRDRSPRNFGSFKVDGQDVGILLSLYDVPDTPMPVFA
jgi:hypothetical protein